MKKTLLIMAALIAICIGASQAQSIVMFDKGRPSKIIQIGVRAGFNTSNLATNYDKAFPDITWNHTQWRQGLTLGAVVDINLRNFFSIQSGLFYKSRGNDFHYLVNDNESLVALDGKWRGNYFEIPLLASLRLGVFELAQLQVDLGPYFATGFGGKVKYDVFETDTEDPLKPEISHKSVKADYFGDKGMVQRYDWGIKTGVGLLLLQHYYLGVHFNYSCRNVLKELDGAVKRPNGHNKAWTFTLGYNF